MLDRRQLLLGAAALGGCAPVMLDAAPATDLIGDVQRRTFAFFWDRANPSNGLMPDRWPSPSFSSIAATGFALTAYPVGVERGWITRAQARERTLATLRFFWTAPQGPQASGVSGYKGFFYHFIDVETGLRFRQCELSSIDTALLVAGMLFAAQYFDRSDEAEIRDLAHRIYARCDWRWFQKADKRVSMGWHPESGFIERPWFGYTEGQILYILALGAPDLALGRDAYDAWCSTYPDSWRGVGKDRHLAFGPHMAHQYTQCWIDLRGIRDKPMRDAGFDYFENSRRATYAQRAYAIANPGKWTGYSEDIWGLCPCDGPADVTIGGRQFYGYAARGPVGLPDGLDDGTIAPTAAVASLPFAPEIVEPATRALYARYGSAIYGQYGFFDSFNPSFTARDVPVQHGRVTETAGWVDSDYLGLDQGPIVAMIENHRSGLIWKYMRQSPAVRAGLQRAGFTGGWLG
ncbi:glucoamylase family protein [Sphingomonas sp.]|uniref:glucoamylase family protein n=1 Tax=Sphingomonas sp. TaxID=28214 RepID=UPI0025EB56CE|nr:glucoamylase family protein [Sphingomonas sp.]